MNKLKRLAKLRQFKGGNVADYLQGEHRQNLLAIEDALRLSDDQAKNTSRAQVNDVLWIWTPKTALANVTTSIATNQPIDFFNTNANSLVNFGIVDIGAFYPQFTGKLLIETQFCGLFSAVNRAMDIRITTNDSSFFGLLNYATDGGGSVLGNRVANYMIDVREGTIIYFQYNSNIATNILSGGVLSLKLTRVA